MVPAVNAMKLDLIDAFQKIGVEITKEDIPIILRLGADKYLDNIHYRPNEECMSSIYIIISEMRNQKN